ncbi:MAG: hypothetical protein ACYTFG_06675 [Planctomycetota bacterium]|jgi:hypothetical protein
MKPSIALGLVLISHLTARQIRAVEPTRSREVLKVMIVSPEGWRAEAGTWADFFARYGIEAKVKAWGETRARRKRFDLVIIVGPGRKSLMVETHLDFEEPVLGLGPYACKIFGKFKLKHGYPHT